MKRRVLEEEEITEVEVEALQKKLGIKTFEDCFGLLKDVPKEEIQEMKNNMKKFREGKL